MTCSERMKNHLIAQFDSKKVMSAVIDSLGAELDEIAAAFEALKEKRWINTGEGAQLDGIGSIVCQSRQIDDAVQIAFFGFFDQPNALGFGLGRFRDSWETWLESVNLNDAEYRFLLWQKVAKNTSGGTSEETIKSIGFIFSAKHVFLDELGNAKVSIAIGRILTPNDISIANAVDLLVRAGGVGVERQSYFDYDNYFGFLGQPNAKGFDEGIFANLF